MYGTILSLRPRLHWETRSYDYKVVAQAEPGLAQPTPDLCAAIARHAADRLEAAGFGILLAVCPSPEIEAEDFDDAETFLCRVTFRTPKGGEISVEDVEVAKGAVLGDAGLSITG